jgi:transcriptional antiterminator NusG
MEEREPEEGTEPSPLAAGAEPAQEALASEVDSARDRAVGADLSPAPLAPAEATAESAASEQVQSPDDKPQPEVPLPGGADHEAAEVEAGAMTPEMPAEPAAEAPRPASLSSGAMRGGRMPQGDVTAEASAEAAWYVIHCYSGYENKVRHNLEQRIETMGMKDRIFDVVIPTQEEIEVREGKRRTVERHIFPGYVLVNMSLSEESWYVVRNTPGVTGFVGMGNLPTALRPEEVSQIIKRMEADAPTVKVSFKVGERVRIIDGPFNDFRGTVADIDMERTKVRVMVSFFGRETPVELDFLQVEKA